MREYSYSMRDKRDKNSISGKTQHCEIFHMQHPPQRLMVEGFCHQCNQASEVRC